MRARHQCRRVQPLGVCLGFEFAVRLVFNTRGCFVAAQAEGFHVLPTRATRLCSPLGTGWFEFRSGEANSGLELRRACTTVPHWHTFHLGIGIKFAHKFVFCSSFKKWIFSDATGLDRAPLGMSDAVGSRRTRSLGAPRCPDAAGELAKRY